MTMKIPTNAKLVYLFDSAGILAGSCVAHPSPLEPGRYLAPAASTEVEPPVVPDGMRAWWTGGVWELEPLPPRPAPLLSPEEQAAQAAVEQAALEVRDAKKDTKIAAFAGMSYGDAKQWAKDGFPSLTLAEQKDLGALAAIVALLARRL
jgi:hypothetical protein